MKQNRFSIDRAVDRSNFQYVQKGKYFLIASAIIVLIGIIVICFSGFNLGIDFTGGSIIEVKTGTILDEGNNYNDYKKQIETVLKNNNLELASVQRAGEGADRAIVLRYQIPSKMNDTEINELGKKIVEELKEKFPDAKISESESIGASASATLLLNACAAILIAVICILIYIAIRFEVAYGLASIFALMHDVLIMFALVAIFRIQINSAFVAAIITIVGYSINNTIVVFDRIRENKKKDQYIGQNVNVLVNDSIKQTLTRSLYTALTTIMAVLLLVIIGVGSLREFVVPILFGLVAGTYSSIFLAAPMWAWMRKGKVSEPIKK